MQKTKKILVPIDFSSCSENALAYAIRLADKIKATVYLLNVTTVDIEGTGNPYVVEMDVEEKKEAARQSLNNSLLVVKKNVSQFLERFPEIETIIEIGSASLMISEIVKRDQLDFIVMGTQGENSIADRLLGSTASTAVKHAPCPLIIIPEGASFQSAIIMGYASNLFNADPFGIWTATKLIRPIQPIAIHCIHFSEKQKYMNDKLDEFKAFFADNAPDSSIYFYSVRTEDKVEDLNDFIIRHNINLMVMYRPLRSFWRALFGESFTQKMSKHINVPLLVLKEENS